MALLALLGASGPAWAGGAMTVFIDPGHGGYELGIRARGVREKDVTLGVALAMQQILRSSDWGVWLSRDIDGYTGLRERIGKARASGAAYYIGIHMSDSAEFVINTADYDRGGDVGAYYSEFGVQRHWVADSARLADSLEQTLTSTYLGVAPVVRRSLPLPVTGALAGPTVTVELPAVVFDDAQYKLEIMRLASAFSLALMLDERAGGCDERR